MKTAIALLCIALMGLAIGCGTLSKIKSSTKLKLDSVATTLKKETNATAIHQTNTNNVRDSSFAKTEAGIEREIITLHFARSDSGKMAQLQGGSTDPLLSGISPFLLSRVTAMTIIKEKGTQTTQGGKLATGRQDWMNDITDSSNLQVQQDTHLQKDEKTANKQVSKTGIHIPVGVWVITGLLLVGFIAFGIWKGWPLAIVRTVKNLVNVGAEKKSLDSTS